MGKDEKIKKKKKAKPIYKGIEFDSFEEIGFYQWCEEAKEHNLIGLFIYHPPSYTLSTKQTYMIPKQLKTKVRYDERELLKPHVFTLDFKIFSFSDRINKLFIKEYVTSGEIVIDVKGKGESADKKRIFTLNQKWLFEKFGVYANMVRADEFFQSTWIPEGYRYTPITGNIKKKFLNTPTISEYLKKGG